MEDDKSASTVAIIIAIVIAIIIFIVTATGKITVTFSLFSYM